MIRENVQVYIYSQECEKVLMLKRTEDRSGYWQPVCGGIEAGETLIEAGIREVYEETGIKEYKELIRLAIDYEYHEPKNGIKMHMRDRCLLMIIERNVEIRLSEEHVEYKWCFLSEVSSLNDWKPMVDSVSLIREII
jgi:8-oxo-dGTP pyrophosphatase MutT (NUDIX family)